MKRLQKMLLLGSIFCLQAMQMTLQVAAQDEKKDYYYWCSVDADNSDFDNGHWKYIMTTHNGLKFSLTQENPFPFFIVNGEISSIPLVVEKGVSFVPLKALCKEINIPYEERGSAITLQHDTNTFAIDTASMTFTKNKKPLSIHPKKINGDIYIPLRGFCELFTIPITYTKGEVMPMFHPFVNIDTREQNITIRKAVELGEEQMQQCYDNFLMHNDVNPKTAKIIKERIDTMENLDDSASFVLVKGPYLLLVDKATGTVYYKTGHGKAGHGSYIETIQEVDSGSTDFFDNY